MNANLDANDIGAIVESLFRHTRDGSLEWKVWSETSLDEEFVASTAQFRYYLGTEDGAYEPAFVRLEIWKLKAAADAKNLQVHELQSSLEDSPHLVALLNVARSSSLSLIDLKDDILNDLGHLSGSGDETP